MRVLLISANTEKINILPIPLGLISVAAAVESRGHDVLMLDLMMHQDFEPPVSQAIRSFHPDVIGISVRNVDDQVMHGARFLLDEVKKVVSACRNLSTVPIVLGGAGYSIFPEAVLSYLQADMGIQGEGEAAFPDLLDRLERHADPEGLPGLYLRGYGQTGKRNFVRDLDELFLADMDRYFARYDRNLWLPFQTRRGCPMNCSYCSTAVIEGRTIRQRSPEAAVEELKKAARAGFRQFYFVDNTFNLPLSYAKEICRLIVRNGLNISWRSIFYPGKFDDELIELMAAAGCMEVSLGFESGSERILKLMNKTFGPDDVRQTSLALSRRGIRQMGFLLLGGPGETRDSVLESLDFADALPLDALKITQGIRIYPHTALARIAIDECRINAGDPLLAPVFYIVPELEDWLARTLQVRMAERPHWTSWAGLGQDLRRDRPRRKISENVTKGTDTEAVPV